MKWSFEVLTTPKESGEIVQQMFDVHDDIRREIWRRILDTSEQQVREALIRLGWTPPIVRQVNDAP